MKTLEIVCGIIKMPNGFLIGRRNSEIHNHIWEFPGGKVELGESNEEALIREIKEELELTVTVVKHVINVLDYRQDVTLNVSAYLCNYVSGNIKLHAHHEVRFVQANELKKYAFEEADKAIINIVERGEL